MGCKSKSGPLSDLHLPGFTAIDEMSIFCAVRPDTTNVRTWHVTNIVRTWHRMTLSDDGVLTQRFDDLVSESRSLSSTMENHH